MMTNIYTTYTQENIYHISKDITKTNIKQQLSYNLTENTHELLKSITALAYAISNSIPKEK